jgi:signal transduction histidine kinase
MRTPFRSLRMQLVMLIVGALALAQAISLWLFVDERSLAIRAALGFEAAGRAANVARLIEEAPPELHPAILRAADSPLVRFSLDPVPTVTHDEHTDGGRIERHIRTLLDDPAPREIRVDLHEIEGRIIPLPHLSPRMAEMHRAMMQGQLRAVEMNLSIALSGGLWLNVGTRFERPPLQWPVLSTLSFGITAAVILIAVLWYVLSYLTGPLAELARSAERFGRGEDVYPLPERGPEEVRGLTRAFNRMQGRLSRFVADRTRMLAAVSHDLRSPLTALRVRAEMVEDDETREALLESVEEMQRMAEATLDFAKGLAGAEPAETVALAPLLRELAEEAAGSLEILPGPELAVRLKPVAIRRALRNLIANAIRYGEAATLIWRREGSDVVIEIRDRGPGIPEAELERVFGPFYRLEHSRSLETGGHGLGLSIARSIIRAHGGEITLGNHPEGGLVARVCLPLDGPEEETETHQKETEDGKLEMDTARGGGEPAAGGMGRPGGRMA